MGARSIIMDPAPGSNHVAHVGDRFRIRLRLPPGLAVRQCFLRCSISADTAADKELEQWEKMGRWQDLPMQACGEDGAEAWEIAVPLIYPGWFQAKAMAIDESGQRLWPEGPDLGISVHPASWRSGNTIYCAFTRMHGATREQRRTTDALRDEQLTVMDRHGWTVIPPSGTLRDLAAQVPHITDSLGCRILHLLPINPTPTTHARYGRFGSPYAATDFTAIDPALVVHDRRSTGLDQFRELVDCVHAHDARLILDLAINHTGWNSTLQNEHPEWFKRNEQGGFISPGAWGTVWEDLTELNHSQTALWDYLSEVFLVWCRRGVDGFRCDAGYMVPLPAWQRITARVRREFPETLFLLEGLGGGWQDTANLLRSGGMQWAYSELFQNHSPYEVGAYLDHCLEANRSTGVLVHYSETHDNSRLAAHDADPEKARRWSLLRNRLCGLTSQGGAFGFTAGVEWLADEKLNVHNSRGLNWGSQQNIIAELQTLNHLLCEHPCFAEDAMLARVSTVDGVIYALHRQAADGQTLLITANLDLTQAQTWAMPQQFQDYQVNLLAEGVTFEGAAPAAVLRLQPGQVVCLAAQEWSANRAGSRRRERQWRSAEALRVLSHHLPLADFGPGNPERLGELLGADPGIFVAAVAAIDPDLARRDLIDAVTTAMSRPHYPTLSHWQVEEHPRINVVPCCHWVLLRHPGPFRYRLRHSQGNHYGRSFPLHEGGHAALIPPQARGEALLQLSCQKNGVEHQGHFRFSNDSDWPGDLRPNGGMALLTNGRGGMSRMAIDLGAIASKYDAALAVNLHPQWPVDRHVLVKRLRAWAEADGYFIALDQASLRAFTNDGKSAHWQFRIACGNQRYLDVHLQAWMPEGENALLTRWWRGEGDSEADLTVLIRPDLEDRSFHAETQRSPEAETHFRQHTQSLDQGRGCIFQPALDRRLCIEGPEGSWHMDEEWSHCRHPIEAGRGQTDHGDAWSPGIYRLRLCADEDRIIRFLGELENPISASAPPRPQRNYHLEHRLRDAAKAYLVRREDGKTVIAGYPWFLDWGRDTLICARGYLAAGYVDEVRDLLRIFGRFEEGGTLPNIIHGENVGNRDTVDAPLWYGIVAEEFATLDPSIYQTDLGNGRNVADVLRSIAEGYLRGTAVGVHCDLQSALVWSPSHFTWMDTNYPAGTPRRGYPIEIQALWIRLLRQLDRLGQAAGEWGTWQELAERASKSLQRLYWLPEHGWWADCLIGDAQTPAAQAVRDTALRSNVVLPIALGVLDNEHARRTLLHVARHLVVPGALRSLAPLRVNPGLPIRGSSGELLNDPHFPYAGVYAGDEDTRRKPAYHNGTAWTWTFPGFCEALVKAWPDDPLAHEAALAYLTTCDQLLERGCIGQIP
ncbi:MAG: amylo-alpha-1,6-glucosidase, partial [Planctomycetota bacterium]